MSTPPINVEFENFSFRSDDGVFSQPSEEHIKALQSYLATTHSIYDMMVSGAWLVLFSNKVPDIDSRPFTIAGSVAIWLSHDDPIPSGILLGSLGLGDEIEMDEKVVNNLKPYRLPRSDTLAAVSEYFETVLFVTFYTTGLVIELPERSGEEFAEALEYLPNGIKGRGISIDYYNGLLATTTTEKIRSKDTETNHPNDQTNTLDINTESKRLLKSTEIQISDQYYINDYPNRRQPLQCMGLRRSAAPPGSENNDIMLQGIYVISPPVTKFKPKHGSPIIRYKKADKGDVLTDGGIVGFLQHSELLPQSWSSGLLCFCDVLGSMIDAGWKVAPGAARSE
ncbi:MAG: hypothetical protein Q9221_003876 [Calogaya cf. arnoldii]